MHFFCLETPNRYLGRSANISGSPSKYPASPTRKYTGSPSKSSSSPAKYLPTPTKYSHIIDEQCYSSSEGIFSLNYCGSHIYFPTNTNFFILIFFFYWQFTE